MADADLTIFAERAWAHLGQGEAEQALAECTAMLEHDPWDLTARLYAALALQMMGEPLEALMHLDEALTRHPDDIEAQTHRVALLIELERFAEAEPACRMILQKQPDHLRALNSLGIILIQHNQWRDALAVFGRIFELCPDDEKFLANYSNLLNFLSHTGQHDAVIAAFSNMAAIRPDDRRIAVNFAMTLLRAGQFAPGWDMFEQRNRAVIDPLEASVPVLPVLTGELDLQGKTILLLHEQGLGDTLQFLRFVPALAQRGARVVLRMPPDLLRIAASVPGCDHVEPRGSTLAFSPDFILPMISLARVFQTTLDNVPDEIPYIFPGEELESHWSARLAALPRPRIGLIWAGQPLHPLDSRRSIGFEALLTLFSVPASFVSLQKGEAATQWAPPAGASALDIASDLNDLADTAAVMASLDLVISVDTAGVHLAGSLGRPVWMLDRFDSCWRWLNNRTDSPWYPSLRIFRQPRPGDWGSVVDAVKSALVDFTTEPRP